MTTEQRNAIVWFLAGVSASLLFVGLINALNR